jgi:hypothetical protein
MLAGGKRSSLLPDSTTTRNKFERWPIGDTSFFPLFLRSPFISLSLLHSLPRFSWGKRKKCSQSARVRRGGGIQPCTPLALPRSKVPRDTGCEAAPLSCSHYVNKRALWCEPTKRELSFSSSFGVHPTLEVGLKRLVLQLQLRSKKWRVCRRHTIS